MRKVFIVVDTEARFQMQPVRVYDSQYLAEAWAIKQYRASLERDGYVAPPIGDLDITDTQYRVIEMRVL